MNKLSIMRWVTFFIFNISISISIFTKNDLLFLSLGIISLITCAILVFGFKSKQPNLREEKQ